MRARKENTRERRKKGEKRGKQRLKYIKLYI
jgi:hypothetical protein